MIAALDWPEQLAGSTFNEGAVHTYQRATTVNPKRGMGPDLPLRVAMEEIAILPLRFQMGTILIHATDRLASSVSEKARYAPQASLAAGSTRDWDHRSFVCSGRPRICPLSASTAAHAYCGSSVGWRLIARN